MQVEINPALSCHRIRIHLRDGKFIHARWAFPAAGFPDECVLYSRPDSVENDFAQPPSADLIALCEARAPWYVILDKLTEEYPQWERYFAAVAEWERGRH